MLSGAVESQTYTQSSDKTDSKDKEDVDGINVLSESLNNIKIVKSINAEKELLINYERKSN